MIKLNLILNTLNFFLLLIIAYSLLLISSNHYNSNENIRNLSKPHISFKTKMIPASGSTKVNPKDLYLKVEDFTKIPTPTPMPIKNKCFCKNKFRKICSN